MFLSDGADLCLSMTGLPHLFRSGLKSRLEFSLAMTIIRTKIDLEATLKSVALGDSLEDLGMTVRRFLA